MLFHLLYLGTGHALQATLRLLLLLKSRDVMDLKDKMLQAVKTLFSSFSLLILTISLITCTGADPYVVVECEGDKSRIPVKKNTLSPIFNSRLMFYPKRPRTAELHIQV